MLTRRGRGRRRAARGRAREVAACGLDHQGESVLAWDAESGAPLTPVVTWQDKRSQEILDRLEADGRADEVRERSGMPLDPYFSAGKLTWLLEHDDGGRSARATTGRCGSARSTRSSATGWAPASPPTPRRLRARSSGAPDWDPSCSRSSACPREVLPEIMDTAGDLGTLRHPTPGPSSCRCARAASTSRRRSPGRAASSRAGSKATYGTGVFVLAHAGEERPEPEGGLLPTVAWRVDGTRRVGDRRRRLHRRRAARVAEPRPRPRGRSGRARGAGGARWRTRAASGCSRRSPGSAPRGGGPRHAAVIAGLTAATRARRMSRALPSRRSRGGWPTSSPWSARPSPWRCCESTAASPADLLLSAAGRLRPACRRARARSTRRRPAPPRSPPWAPASGVHAGDRRSDPGRRPRRARPRRRLAPARACGVARIRREGAEL